MSLHIILLKFIKYPHPCRAYCKNNPLIYNVNGFSTIMGLKLIWRFDGYL